MGSATPSKPIKRLRVFAGPNGAGKSSMCRAVKNMGVHLGKWVNADDVLLAFRKNVGSFTLGECLEGFDEDAFRAFYCGHPLASSEKLPWCFSYSKVSGRLDIDPDVCANESVAPYVMSILVDYIRTQLLDSGQSFSFETVFSHQSKLDFIMKAKQCGYRVYLYFVCLEPPDLCLSRVAIRVAQHGHDVPSDKVLERYRRCLDLLPNAIKIADRSYLFDNSETASGEKIESSLVIEVERADDTFSIVTHRSELPAWISNHIPFKFP
jgi:predicted ABC-type ATPase